MTDAFNRETITRKELDSKLRDLVKASKTRNIIGVIVYSSNNPDILDRAWSNDFCGKRMKDDLFCFLMGKSLTSRIVDVQTGEIMGLLYVRIIISQDGKPLKRTNIDGKTMGFLEKARYVS